MCFPIGRHMEPFTRKEKRMLLMLILGECDSVPHFYIFIVASVERKTALSAPKGRFSTLPHFHIVF